MHRRGRRRVVVLMALSVFTFSLCGLVASALATGHDPPGFEQYGATTRAEVPITPQPAEASETPGGPPLRFPAPVEIMTIPAIRISAPLVALGVRPDGYMDLPNSPHEVAWYSFTAKPGMGGNAVFSAHLDYINYGPAVFWNLAQLRPGDDVAVKLTDGTILNYAVTLNYTVALEQLDLPGILAPTEVETVTLITCAGVFSNEDYSHRVIVRAIRTSAQRATPQ